MALTVSMIAYVPNAKFVSSAADGLEFCRPTLPCSTALPA